MGSGKGKEKIVYGVGRGFESTDGRKKLRITTSQEFNNLRFQFANEPLTAERYRTLEDFQKGGVIGYIAGDGHFELDYESVFGTEESDRIRKMFPAE
jgi:hypothetical protein